MRTTLLQIINYQIIYDFILFQIFTINYIRSSMQTNSKLFADLKVSALAFSPDGKYIAVALKFNNIINVYALSNQIALVDSWVLQSTIKEQTQQICQLSWSSKDKILSCSHDRSAVVWKRNNNAWTKQLVNLDNKLSIVTGIWAPNGKKFAIGSSDKICTIGFFNNQEHFWGGKSFAFKKQSQFTSSITSLAFHQSSNVVAIGSSDFSFRVVTCNFTNTQQAKFAAENNHPLDTDDQKYKGAFDNTKTFGVQLLRVEGNYGWINNLTFCGNYLAVFIHNNKILIQRISEEKDKNQQESFINWKGLPILSGYFKDDRTIIAGGFDKKVAVFKKAKQTFEFDKYLESNLVSKLKTVQKKTKISEISGNMFRKESKSEETTINAHKNPIKILPINRLVCSWDVNGIINFWEC